MFRYFDAHSHVHAEEYDVDREAVLSRMREGHVGTITVGTNLETSRKAVLLAEKTEGVWATIGLHPVDTKDSFDKLKFEELVSHPKVVGIGECGLDYFRLKEDIESEKDRQRKNFLDQVEFSVAFKKPLMIHCRPSSLFGQEEKNMDAHEEMISLLKEKKAVYGENLRGNIHFFTGTITVAKEYSALNFSVSFPGVVTFTKEYDELIRNLDFSMVLSETDAPYASPTPYRGRRNEPLFVIETVRHLAFLRGEKEAVTAHKMLQNAARVFGISL